MAQASAVHSIQSASDLPAAQAPYATDWRKSQGRLHDEPSADDRTPFQRDRDRIVYADAFRRLQYKTQVFMNSEEGDFRTRLTHTLEVAQLTRAICRFLQLDEDLGEAIALAHDLGHPPFGHAGEDALNDCMKDYGGFEHNVQTLLILRQLESPYAQFDGLNLSWEVLEGVAKHNGIIERKLSKNELFKDLAPGSQPGLEAQVAAACDALAYKHHDLDDGLATGKLHLEEVLSLPQFKRVWDEVSATYPRIAEPRKIKEAIRRLINRQVRDILANSKQNFMRARIQTLPEVRAQEHFLVGFSEEVAADNEKLSTFLFHNLYRHTSVNRFNFQAHRIIRDLFNAFMNHRKMLPIEWREKLPEEVKDVAGKARVVCNYLASLTDRSAMQEHQRLFAPINYVGL
jgi:dGTPase